MSDGPTNADLLAAFHEVRDVILNGQRAGEEKLKRLMFDIERRLASQINDVRNEGIKEYGELRAMVRHLELEDQADAELAGKLPNGSAR